MTTVRSRLPAPTKGIQSGNPVDSSLPTTNEAPTAGVCPPRLGSPHSHESHLHLGQDAVSEYLRTAGVLELLPISRRTLCRWMDSGRIRFIRAGSRLILFRRSDIEKMLARFTVGRAV